MGTADALSCLKLHLYVAKFKELVAGKCVEECDVYQAIVRRSDGVVDSYVHRSDGKLFQ